MAKVGYITVATEAQEYEGDDMAKFRASENSGILLSKCRAQPNLSKLEREKEHREYIYDEHNIENEIEETE